MYIFKNQEKYQKEKIEIIELSHINSIISFF